MFFRLYLPWQWAHSSRQPLIQPGICALGTHYGWVGGPSQCGIQSLANICTHGQHSESNPRPSDLESNALSTSPHAKYMWLHEHHSSLGSQTTDTLNYKRLMTTLIFLEEFMWACMDKHIEYPHLL